MSISLEQPKLFQDYPSSGTKLSDIYAEMAMKEINRIKTEQDLTFRARSVALAPMNETVVIDWLDEPPLAAIH